MHIYISSYTTNYISKKRKASATRKPRAKTKTKAKSMISFATITLMLTGVLTGVFLCLLFIKLYNNNIGINTKANKSATNLSLSKKTTQASNTSNNNKSKKQVEPRFDFYTLLPKSDSGLQQGNKQAKNKAKSKPSPKSNFKESQPSSQIQKNKSLDLKTTDMATEYSIQAGSFRALQDADELKAKLTLNGFNSHIEKARIGDQEWHRVFVGPMDSEKMALSQQELLLQILKIKGTLVLKRG